MKTSRRLLLLAALAAAGATSSVGVSAPAVDLSSATILDLQAALDAGSLTSEKLMQLYLARIEAYDQKGPALNSVIVLSKDPLAEARAMDDERKAKGPRSPLHGIPILVKDVFDVAGLPTAGGFKPMAHSFPTRDGFVIHKLRAAGAIVFGKLNQSDWFGVASQGASTLKGQVKNPYDLTRVPGYSSSGTGASIAAWFAAAGLGSDTGGSVQIPAADSNLYGMVASKGAISRTGMICSAPLRERGGPICRSMTDLAVMMSYMVGFDAEDLLTAESLGQLPQEPYTTFLRKDALKGARLGVLRSMFHDGPDHAEGNRLIAEAIELLKKSGAVIIDPATPDVDPVAGLAQSTARSNERMLAHNWYLSRLPPDAPIRSVDEMIAKAGDIVKPTIKDAAVGGSVDHHAEYLAGLKANDTVRASLIALMDRLQLDALIYPFKTVPPQKIGGESNGPRSGISSRTGLPALNAPAGLTKEGLPISLQFLGRPFSEPTLIGLGYSYEQAAPKRVPPPTTPALKGETIMLPGDNS